MPAVGLLEGEGFRPHTLVATFKKGTRGLQAKLQQALKAADEQTLRWTRESASPGEVSQDDPITHFVYVKALLTQRGIRIVNGKKSNLGREMEVVVEPKHAHGGCYTYAPVAEQYAKTLQVTGQAVGLKFDVKEANVRHLF